MPGGASELPGQGKYELSGQDIGSYQGGVLVGTGAVTGGASELLGRERYELLGSHTENNQDDAHVQMQGGQAVTNGPYEMPYRQYDAHQPVAGDGVNGGEGERRGHGQVQIHYHEKM